VIIILLNLQLPPDGTNHICSPEESYDQFNTNVFGMMNVSRAVLPYMRAQKSGVIANFGSLGSWHGGAAYALYAGTKWACSGISESMRQELAPLGITVTVIEPGYFRTGFLNPGAQIKSKQVIEDYDKTVVGDTKRLLEKVDNNQPGDAEKGSKVIVDVLTKTGVGEGKEIPIRLVLGSDCQNSIREKLDETKTLLDEWKDISNSTDY
jgi:NAD(P)-dependent dehydrogenase (short-subunit alcohol dehydrogenase family)